MSYSREEKASYPLYDVYETIEGAMMPRAAESRAIGAVGYATAIASLGHTMGPGGPVFYEGIAPERVAVGSKWLEKKLRDLKFPNDTVVGAVTGFERFCEKAMAAAPRR